MDVDLAQRGLVGRASQSSIQADDLRPTLWAVGKFLNLGTFWLAETVSLSSAITFDLEKFLNR